MSDCDKECKYFPVSMKCSRAALALSYSIVVSVYKVQQVVMYSSQLSKFQIII